MDFRVMALKPDAGAPQPDQVQVAGEENGSGRWGGLCEQRSAAHQILAQQVGRVATGRDNALPAVFPIADPDGAMAADEILKIETGEFLPAQPGGIKQFKDGEVAKPQRIISSDGSDFLPQAPVFGVKCFLKIELTLQTYEQISGHAEAKLEPQGDPGTQAVGTGVRWGRAESKPLRLRFSNGLAWPRPLVGECPSRMKNRRPQTDSGDSVSGHG